MTNNNFIPSISAAFLTTALLLLSACGGGSDSDGNNENSDNNGSSPTTHTVSATANTGGAITPASRTVNEGDTTTFTVSPDSGFDIGSVTGCSGSLSGDTYTTGAINSDCTVMASFDAVAASTHTVTVTANSGGTVNPSSVTVSDGDLTTITVTPNGGFNAAANGCGGSLSGNTYTTGPITADCTVTVTFSGLTPGPNSAPVVDAGPDQTIALPAVATLDATISDDGLPSNSITISWRQDSGPGTATFSPDDQEDTSVSFSTDGTYVLSVGADDGMQSTVDTVTVTVNPAPGNATQIVIDPATRYQTITGWEATTDISRISPDFDSATVPEAVLPILANEVGINRIRLEIRSGAENPNDHYANFRDAGFPAPPNNCSTSSTHPYCQWRLQRYSAINDDGNANQLIPRVAGSYRDGIQGFHFTEFDDHMTNIVLPMKQLLESRGEKLWINLCYVAFWGGVPDDGSGNFLPGYGYDHQDPEEYAEFIEAVYLYMEDKYGFVPDSVEILLEPDNTDTTGKDMGEWMVAVSNRLLGHGYTPRLVAPSTSALTATETYMFHPTSGAEQIPNAFNNLVEIAYHRYKNTDLGGEPGNTAGDALLMSIANEAANRGVQTSHLEFIGAHYDHLYRDLALANVSAWSQYAIAISASANCCTGGNYMTWNASGQTVTASMNQRTPYLAQYMRYIREGYVRVGTNMDGVIPTNGDWRALAFESPTGEMVVVATVGVHLLPDGRNSTNGPWGTPAQTGVAKSISVSGLPAGTYTVTYSTASNMLVDAKIETIIAGQTLEATIPDDGVITIHP